MKFKASLDGLAKGITVGISVIFAVIITGNILVWENEVAGSLLLILLLAFIYLLSYFYHPIDYDVTKDNLIIHRPIKNVIIKRQDIKRVLPISREQTRWTIRTFGVGGLFGYFGHFVNSKLGNMIWYATRRNKTVLIETLDDQKLVVTPDEPEEFIKLLNEP